MYRLLVVDDEPKVRWRVQHVVTSLDFGWQCMSVSDGLEALEVLEDQPADLVIADVRMPKMDGLELLEELRGRGDSTLVAMLSAYADFTYARQALRLGALDYLVKPFSAADLRDVLLRSAQILALEAPGEKVQRTDSANDEILRTRLLTELLEGRLPVSDWHARARTLGIDAVAGQVVSLRHEPGASEAVLNWVAQLQPFASTDQFIQVVVWDRTNVSLIILTRRAASLRPSNSGVAPGEPIRRHLELCPVPHTALGFGATYAIDKIGGSYLESLSALHEVEHSGIRKESPDERAFGPVSLSAQRAVVEACAWIDMHYAEAITLSDIARAVHFHPKYLCTVFPSVAGCSFGAYVSGVRVRHARTLLAETTMPCHVIAEQVGYHDERSLAQAFRRHVGITPHAYRKAHGQRIRLRDEDLTPNDQI